MNYTEILFLIGRILYGGFFVMNGMNHFTKMGMMKGYAASKGVPVPALTVPFTGLLLLFGGAGVLLGVSVQWALLAVIIFLVPVTFIMHKFWAVTDPMMKMGEMVNFTKNMALLGATLMMFAISSPWIYSIF